MKTFLSSCCSCVITFEFDTQAAKHTPSTSVHFPPLRTTIERLACQQLSWQQQFIVKCKRNVNSDLAFLPPASYRSNARVIPMFVKKRQIKTEVKRQKMRMNVWLFDFRMTVYDQDHSSYKINGHHLESKCPNITTCTLTAAWHCEPILACFLNAGRGCVYF